MNPYDELNVRKNATQEEIEYAYKSLLDKYAPRNYQGDLYFAQKRIQSIKEAYRIIGDMKSRNEYDIAHEIHTNSHNSNKDSYKSYYKKEPIGSHEHDDYEIAQAKYKKFQKYTSTLDDSLEEDAIKDYGEISDKIQFSKKTEDSGITEASSALRITFVLIIIFLLFCNIILPIIMMIFANFLESFL